jgi:alkylresorcinol/alkylpyrone synthase
VVLEVSVELSSLHVQPHSELRALLPNLLFGDGAGAAIWSAEEGLGSYLGGASFISPDSTAAMTWRIGDHGFEMFLSPDVPEALEVATPTFVEKLLAPHGLDRGRIAGWAIHPGGKRIVESVGRALDLDAAALAPSLETLRDVGNVSSATIFFVIEALRARALRGPIVLLAFGPGLTLEGAVVDLG